MSRRLGTDEFYLLDDASKGTDAWVCNDQLAGCFHTTASRQGGLEACLEIGASWSIHCMCQPFLGSESRPQPLNLLRLARNTDTNL